jgi:poly(3-hydroxyalkanoate) synthetase
MAEKKRQMSRITPDELLSRMGVTPADNREGYSFVVPWKSKMVGGVVKSMIKWDQVLESISQIPFFGPYALAAYWQRAILDKTVLDPLKQFARFLTLTGRNPDMFGEMNSWIYLNHARLLHSLCGNFITDGNFDVEKARRLTTTEEGKAFLVQCAEEFAFLERNFNSLGLTRLKAMKELLISLLVVITETPLKDDSLPYMPKKADGSDALPFSTYLEEGRLRFENLYTENAFDIKDYAERATGGKIGYCPFEMIEGSNLHSVVLRHYLPLVDDFRSNGKVLYLNTPLINKPEIYDMAQGKSIVEGMLKEGYEVYLVEYGDAGFESTRLGLDFYGKTVHDHYLDMIGKRHPKQDIYVMGYCMGGTLILPYLARRAEERMAQKKPMDIKKVALVVAPVKFDDGESGHAKMREIIRTEYDQDVIEALFGDVNIPPQVIEFGMNEIQAGVSYYMANGFYSRAVRGDTLRDSAPFLYWLTHGTKFPVQAHREWLQKVYMENQIYEGTFCLPSSVPALDGKPVNMDALKKARVAIFCYRGDRDPIAPPGSCISSEIWGLASDQNIGISRGGLNRTIEKHVGHVFVVSKTLLAEYLSVVTAFFRGDQSIPVKS